MSFLKRQGSSKMALAKEGGISFLEAAGVLSSLVGHYVWGMRDNFGRVLTFDLGEPHLRIREPIQTSSTARPSVRRALRRRLVIPTGNWHFFVEDGFWALETSEAVVDRFGNQDEIEACIKLVDGQKVISCSMSPESGQLNLRLDLGGGLTIGPSKLIDREDWSTRAMWTIYFKTGASLSVRNDGALDFQG